jgi:hypothetical protein
METNQATVQKTGIPAFENNAALEVFKWAGTESGANSVTRLI